VVGGPLSDSMNLNRWTGEFSDQRLEERFRAQSASAEIKLLKMLIGASAIGAPFFILIVLMRYGLTPDSLPILLVRTLGLALQIFLFVAMFRSPSRAFRDGSALIVLAAIFLSFINVLVRTDDPGAALSSVPIAIAVFAIVLGLGRTHHVVAASFLLVTVYGVLYFDRPGTTVAEGVAFIALAWIAIGISTYFKLQLAISQRWVWQQTRILKEAVDDLENARIAAEAANEAKSRFLANMSHEIRTPLNGVLGMAQALVMDDMRPNQKEKVEAIVESGESLLTILNDVLDISKIESGKVELSPIETDLRLGLSRIDSIWRPLAEEKGLTFTTGVDDDVPELLVFDAVRIRQCATNLISNAIKFTSKGSVAVRASVRPGSDDKVEVVVTVSDTGIGMTKETLARLFQPFQQADASITREFGGTGLGLAISRELAQLSGGDVTIESLPGVGSVATLSFLASLAEQGAAIGQTVEKRPKRQSAARMLIGKKVLVVDDNKLNRDLARILLSKLECEVIEATNGQEALTALDRGGVDLMLLDIHMPVMDGREVIRTIRKSTKPYANLPVIALTADAMSGEREALLALGMTGYVSKPIDNVQLATEIRRAISVSSAAGAEINLRNAG